MIRQYSTVNTFTRTPVPAQIGTYLIFIGQALTFFICMYVNFLSTVRQIIILVLYIVSMAAQIYFTLMASCSDPSDSMMIEYRNNANGRNNLNVDNCLYCEVCTSYVKETSRHCKVCQRCVQDFDHHCMWINNCIGSRNYKSFLAMTVTTLINLLFYIVGLILLWTEGNWEYYLGSMVTLWIFSFLVVIFSIMLLNLIGLHIYLIYKGMTTYQFIILQRQQNKKKKQQQQLKERQNKIQITRQIIMSPVKNKNLNGQIERQSPQQRLPPMINQVQVKSQQNLQQQHQNSVDIIFGQQINQEYDVDDTRTKKSSYKSRNMQQIHHNTLQTGQNIQKQTEEQPASFSSKRQNKDNLSQFFTKNKSLKFFIGDQVGQRPQSSRNKVLNSKQKQYQSARVPNKQVNPINFLKNSQKNKISYVSQKR